MATGATAHVATSLGNDDHIGNQNSKPQHTHIPRVYNGVDTTFNSMKQPGGGSLECGVCGEILQDSVGL